MLPRGSLSPIEATETVKIKELIKNPARAARYVERHVNDGSPSGFSEKFTTSRQTSPFGLTHGFNLHICRAPADWCRTYGEIPQWPAGEGIADTSWILIHPDMAENRQLVNPEVSLSLVTEHRVVPTASGRTVQYVNGIEPDYVKLHYDGILGRINRALPFTKSISGPEVSRIVCAGISEGLLCEKMAVLPEVGARTVTLPFEDGFVEWGMTWRSHKPYGKTAKQVHFAIPAYGLFSTDRFASYDLELLVQIIRAVGGKPEDYVLEKLVIPMLDCYFSVVQNLGLHLEWNAQNLLIGFDEELCPVAFISRDLKSVDKDLTMRERLGLPNDFDVHPFKCIEKGQYNYAIKHSFMFDHKFGDYVIDPILSVVSEAMGCKQVGLRAAVRDAADAHIRKLPGDFFPEDDCWYMFRRVLVDQDREDRPYLALKNPKFRTPPSRLAREDD